MATMKQTKSVSVLDWIAYRLSQAIASMKPRYSTADVQALVASSGNPAGG